jgi:hypothetical protein
MRALRSGNDRPTSKTGHFPVKFQGFDEFSPRI